VKRGNALWGTCRVPHNAFPLFFYPLPSGEGRVRVMALADP
jgi:hypothetical protein